MIRCRACGKVNGFCTRKPVTGSICKECGEATEYGKMRQAFVHCECGRRWVYLTNIEDEMFDIDCLECGAPVTVEWSAKKNVYTTVTGHR